MNSAEEEIEAQADNWEYAMTLTEKEDLLPRNTIVGSQLVRPLLEFNGACPGCGETPYIRLLTQLFGDRMMIANATGCSSIWGASAPSIAYSTTAEGKGPAWANSLFEDNAEYGYGMFLAVDQIRDRVADLMVEAQKTIMPEPIKDALQQWLDNKEDAEGSKKAAKEIIRLLEKNEHKNGLLLQIMKYKDYLVKRSFWMIGGDGWAYDIGYGGLDHVLSTGRDVNLFVMDTEIYSNTGGQSSKATPTAAVAKFATKGKQTRKKDLGLMAMSYGDVYVAQIALGANMNQTLKAMIEAEKYKGPSLIIAYSPCISHGIKTGMGTSILQEKKAVEAGYWNLYRYNPELKEQEKNPFILDSKEPKASYTDYLNSEVRYSQLATVFPDTADELFQLSEKHAKERLEVYKKL
jgi:pyruvate-ferredoxin/flavodoxin oxidoreductase